MVGPAASWGETGLPEDKKVIHSSGVTLLRITFSRCTIPIAQPALDNRRIFLKRARRPLDLCRTGCGGAAARAPARPSGAREERASTNCKPILSSRKQRSQIFARIWAVLKPLTRKFVEDASVRAGSIFYETRLVCLNEMSLNCPRAGWIGAGFLGKWGLRGFTILGGIGKRRDVPCKWMFEYIC